jgi:excisionase family DNA binding protein
MRAALRAIVPLRSEQLRVITVQQLMTPEQLADYLQVEVSTLYVWVSRGRLPRRKVGHLLRFDLEEIIAWTKGSETDYTVMLVKALASKVRDEAELRDLIGQISSEAQRSMKGKRVFK